MSNTMSNSTTKHIDFLSFISFNLYVRILAFVVYRNLWLINHIFFFSNISNHYSNTIIFLTNGDIEVSRSLAQPTRSWIKTRYEPSNTILFYSFFGSPVLSLFLKSTNPKTAQVAIPSPSKTSTPANAQGHQGVEDPLPISLETPSSGFAFLY